MEEDNDLLARTLLKRQREENRPISDLMLKGDHKHLSLSLAKLPVNDRPTVKKQYKVEFLAGIDEELIPYRKNNSGRRRANLYLLKQLENECGDQQKTSNVVPINRSRKKRNT